MTLLPDIVEQVVNLLLMTCGLIVIAGGLGWGVNLLLVRVGYGTVRPFERALLGILLALLIIAAGGVIGLQPSHVVWALGGVAGSLIAVWIFVTRPTLEVLAQGLRKRVRFHETLVVGAVVVAIPFLPLFRFGPTTWTLISNDFTLFSSWLAVWESASPEAFSSRFPDAWGSETLRGAAVEKPVAIASLGLFSNLAFGSVLGLQTGALLIVVISTYVLLWSTCRNLCGKVPVWAALVIAVGLVGLYPWARVLHANWGHAIAVWALAAALFWATRPAEPSQQQRWTLLNALITGVMIGAAFGANYELTTLLSLTMLALLLGLVVLRQGATVGRSLVGWALGIAIAASFSTIGATRILLDWITVARDGDLQAARAEINFPSPLGVVGLQTGYGSVSLTQSLAMWAVVIGAALTGSLLFKTLGSRELQLVIGAIAISLASLMLAFGPDHYATGKYVSGLIPLVVPIAVAGLISRPLPFPALVVAVPISIVAVIISTYWSYLVPIVVPRDLIALRGSNDLRDLRSVNVDLGNYYENNAAALVIPTAEIFVVDEKYGGETGRRATFSLVRLEKNENGDPERIIPLNDTYGLLKD